MQRVQGLRADFTDMGRTGHPQAAVPEKKGPPPSRRKVIGNDHAGLAEIEALRRRYPNRNVLRPDEEWMSRAEAEAALATRNDNLLSKIPHISASLRKGRHCTRGAGSLYSRELIARIAKIKHECRVGATVAVRIEAALREGRIP